MVQLKAHLVYGYLVKHLLVPEGKSSWERQSEIGVLGSEGHATDAVLSKLEKTKLFRV